MRNRTMIQFFEWYLPSDCSLWRQTCEKAELLAKLGFTDIWLPPAYKCKSGINDVGYGVYDMYDLGEFNQKGTIPTKYGTKDEYLTAIKTLQQFGLAVYADVVFNHRMGADHTETVNAYVVDRHNRNHIISKKQIEAWTKFDFLGRNKEYSDFTFNHTHFDGCDWDEKTNLHEIYLFDGKVWDTEVDTENVNYDYLMGADLDLNNKEIFNELINWGKWYLDFTGVDGFRIDAVKHINSTAILKWLIQLRDYTGKDIFAVGEYWNSSLTVLLNYLDKTANSFSLFDVPLHYNFYRASTSHGNYDMSKILDNSLLISRPKKAVTIVDNHDTQPGQALESFIPIWFKLHAYALILLREEGLPCVFYGDLFGIPHNNIPPVGHKLEMLLKARHDLAYGEQIDYFNDNSVVGFTRLGDSSHIHSGLAVVMTDSTESALSMSMGVNFIGKTMVDCLGNCTNKVVVEEDGRAHFTVKAGSISVYVDEDYFVNNVK